MNAEQRLAGYLAQTGRKAATPRQRRRLQHKSNHVNAPFGTRPTRPVRRPRPE